MKGRGSKAARWLAAAVALAAAQASASTVNATSTTLLTGRPDVRYGEVHSAVPIVELVGLSAQGFEVPAVDDLKLRVSGWGRLDAARTGDLAGDLEVAFLQGRLLDRRLALTLGRHIVTGGAARFTQLDGASAEVAIARGFGVAAYGGLPVVPRFAVARGDAVFGGRLFWRRSVSTEVGASVVNVLDHGVFARQDLGLDARYQATKALAVAGYGLWSLAEARLAEVDVGPTYSPTSEVQVSAQYRRTAPDLFLPRSSIFSVFAETRRDEVGASAQYQPRPYLSLFADYHSLWTGDGRGDDLGARASFRSDPTGTTTLAAQARWLRIPSNGYVQVRLSGTRKLLPRLLLALDLDGYAFSQPINGATMSTTAAVTGAYAFAPGWQAVLSGTAGETPLLAQRFELFAKLVYDYSTTTTGKTP